MNYLGRLKRRIRLKYMPFLFVVAILLTICIGTNEILKIVIGKI
jgi:hypothetical protein